MRSKNQNKTMNSKQGYNAATRKGKSTAGKRADLGGQFFRSKTEANYARFLNLQANHGFIRDWEYEPDTFKFPVERGQTFYVPDFKIFNKDGSIEYHEIKGWVDKASQTKLNRMKKFYPAIKVIVITMEELKARTKNSRYLISKWE